jgi:hypothetical protein
MPDISLKDSMQGECNPETPTDTDINSYPEFHGLFLHYRKKQATDKTIEKMIVGN